MKSKTEPAKSTEPVNLNGLVSAEECLAGIFPSPASRPCLRHFINWRDAGYIPYLKFGRRVFYNPGEVKAALERRMKIKEAA